MQIIWVGQVLVHKFILHKSLSHCTLYMHETLERINKSCVNIDFIEGLILSDLYNFLTSILIMSLYCTVMFSSLGHSELNVCLN